MENRLKNRNKCRKRRVMRIRKQVRGEAIKPRLSVFKSNKHLSAQIIDDQNQKTLFGISTLSEDLKSSKKIKKSKSTAKEIGKRIAEAAKKMNIERVVFDRGHYKYHGLIAELADSAREAGLTF